MRGELAPPTAPQERLCLGEGRCEPKSARTALAADLLVELDPVALLGRLAALLAAHPADLPEEVVTVPLLGGLAALAAGLSPAHFLGLRHPTTSSHDPVALVVGA